MQNILDQAYSNNATLNSKKRIVQEEIGAIDVARRAEAVTFQNTRNQISNLTSALGSIVDSSVNLVQARENSVVANFKYTKEGNATALTNSLKQIDLDQGQTAKEKALAKKALLAQYRASSEAQNKLFEESNEFILQDSNLQLSSITQQDELLFQKLNDTIEAEYAKEDIIETEKSMSNATKSLSSYVSIEAIDEQAKVISQYFASRSDLSAPEREARIMGVSQKADKAKFDLIKTNALLTAQANPKDGLEYIDQYIGELRGNENYLPNLQEKATRIEELLKSRKSILKAVNEVDREAIVANTLTSYNPSKTADQMVLQLQASEAYKTAPSKDKEKLLTQTIKEIEKFEERPADWVVATKANPEYAVPLIQQELNGYGLGYKSAIPTPKQEAMKRTFDQIGIRVMKDSAGNDITATREFENAINDQLQILGGENQKAILVKEAKLNLSGLQSLAVEAYVRNTDNADQLKSLTILANKNGGSLPAKNILSQEQESAKTAEYFSSKKGDYEYRRKGMEAMKDARTMVDIANYLDKDISKVINQFSADEYISTSRFSLKFDKREYDGGNVKYGVRKVLQNPEAFFDNELDIPQKYDVTSIEGNQDLEAWTDDVGYVYFAIPQPEQGKVIRRMHIKELPMPTGIFDKYNPF